ncbi:uncharacterized protein [Choristoneura fumiferana]|uniref:uncharacterized protein n=1 Tax=Choristoneura fumiferana TaxID=7141 RepID=UPI003D15996F
MRSAIVVAALLSVAEGSIKYCGAKMCGGTNEHTFCKYHGPATDCVGYIEDRLTHDERTRVLARLNRRRSEAAGGKLPRLPTAGNMLKLHWVDELAREAQLWADQCMPPNNPEEHDDCRDLFSITVGQCVSSVVGEAPGLRPESMVDTWYLQGLQYKGNVTTYVSSDKYADFGQMIWAHTFMVGCARSRFTSPDYVHERARTVIRLVCNFAPRGPAGELWLPAAPGAACPTHTQRDTQLPNLCNQANLTSNIGPSNDMTLKERSLLNAVLEIERNQLLEHPGSLDELYLTNMAIATLNHPVTTESYFKTTYKQDIIESTIFEDDKQIDKARNSIRETTKVISKMEHKNRRPKTTKLITRLSMVGRPKSYDVEELEDPYMEGYANTRSVETATLNEKDLYAEYEEQDISETTAEYDIKTTLKDAVVSTTMSISELELYSTEEVSSTQNLAVHPSITVSNSLRTEAENIKNHHLLRLLELSKMNEEFPSNPQTAEALQDALEHVEKTLSAGETSGKVRRELRRDSGHPRQEDLSQDYANQDESQDLNAPNIDLKRLKAIRDSQRKSRAEREYPDSREDPDPPAPQDSPIRTLDKTPTLNMIIKYLPFMKEYQKYMSLSSNNSPCVVIIFVSLCVSLGSM